MSVLHLPVTTDVLLLYPGESLKDQIGRWAMRHPEWRVETAAEWMPMEVRARLRSASAAVVDATEDPARAREVFVRAVARLGANAVVMYTERMHDALELFVRRRGSLFLLGPLFHEQWEESFQRWLKTKDSASAARLPLRRFVCLPHRPARGPAWPISRFGNSLDWPITEMN